MKEKNTLRYPPYIKVSQCGILWCPECNMHLWCHYHPFHPSVGADYARPSFGGLEGRNKQEKGARYSSCQESFQGRELNWSLLETQSCAMSRENKMLTDHHLKIGHTLKLWFITFVSVAGSLPRYYCSLPRAVPRRRRRAEATASSLFLQVNLRPTPTLCSAYIQPRFTNVFCPFLLNATSNHQVFWLVLAGQGKWKLQDFSDKRFSRQKVKCGANISGTGAVFGAKHGQPEANPGSDWREKTWWWASCQVEHF